MPFATELLVVATALSNVQMAPAPRRPFSVGERAEYSVAYLVARGNASMEVLGIEPIRNRDAFRFRLTLEGGGLGYRLRDTSQSWVDTATFHSLRYYQDQEERGRDRVRRWEIFPDRQVYRDGTNPERPSVAAPLDDVSFLYFVRTIPLEVGATLEYSNYFRPESNPVRIRVLKRERIEVPAGRFNAVVLQPIIKTRGIFSESGRAQVWVSDDSARVILQIQTKMPVLGTLTMKLRNYRSASGEPFAPRRD